ncbi:serpin family protein [Nocardiopsis sp. JB363]|uniref:serpin family protein n=1 Tax=Nocardiopsis sp. JB363 TaxID=1434837 RepID=UPI00097B3504|nr:serpin family protein [Nocardiopsis sp. JB363]SIO88901.1 proteinase inhibitor I4, serpin [Nocardiopsis sp. JB363]
MSTTGQDHPPQEDHARFAAVLERELSEKDTSHIWSPYSVGAVLTLLAEGAGGRTRRELTDLLAPDGDLTGHVAALDEAVATAEGLDLAVLNGLYVPADLPVRADFEERVRSRAGAEVDLVDFRGDAEGVRRKINARVGEVTQGLIDELLSPGTIDPDVRMLLVNALWVKMVWRDPFEVERTKDRPFHSPAGKRKVPTMHRTGRMLHAERDGWRMVSLPGEHGLTLDVFLGQEEPPDERTLRDLYRHRRQEQIELALPRFAVDSDIALLDPLAAGAVPVRALATDDADFSGISAEPLKVDAIVHQSVLRVDERGAEGAAATAAVMTMAAAIPTKPKRFTVDRPFRVALRRGPALLFTGHVTEPVDPGPARSDS